MTEESLPLRTRLANDLRVAMKQRDETAVRTLRSLLEAMDNAGAVPLTSEHVPVYGRPNEVPRQVVTESDYLAILQREAEARREAADEYERLGRKEAAERVRAEWQVARRYVGS
jgi:uncharacterized protein